MSTYAFIHAAGGTGWDWHLVAAELRARGHRTVAPDLPAADDTATLADYADVVVDAIGDAADVVVVAHSFGAFTAPLVAVRRPVSGLVLVAGMVPAPGEPPAEWWSATGWERSTAGPATADPMELYYHDVRRDLALESLRRETEHPSTAAYSEPWPLDHWPRVPTRVVACTEDRLFPPEFLRRITRERLGIATEELVSGHFPALARPDALAELLCCSPPGPTRVTERPCRSSIR